MSSEAQNTDPDTTCKTCGKVLATHHGLRSHHLQVHGEDIVDRTCALEGCDDQLSSRGSKVNYCSTECSRIAKTDRITIECDCCYKEKDIIPWQYERSESNHCSTRCRDIAQRMNYGEGDKIQQKTRPGTFKELVRHAYVYEGHSFEATCRIVTHELDGDYSQEEIGDMVSELMSHEKNVRNRVWALRPEDLGLSPIGEVAQ